MFSWLLTLDTQTCRMNALNVLRVSWDECEACAQDSCPVFFTRFIFNHAPFKPINNAGWCIKGEIKICSAYRGTTSCRPFLCDPFHPVHCRPISHDPIHFVYLNIYIKGLALHSSGVEWESIVNIITILMHFFAILISWLETFLEFLTP